MEDWTAVEAFVAPFVKRGAKTKLVDDGDELVCSGKYGARPYRLEFDGPDRLGLVKVKLDNSLGVLLLNHDPSAEPTPPQDGDADWDDDPVEERYLVAPGVLIEQYPEQMKEMRATLARLQAQAIEMIVLLVTKWGTLDVDHDVVQVKCRKKLRDLTAAHVKELIEGVSMLASHFETGGARVAPRPKVFMRGKAVDLAAAMITKTCEHCGMKGKPTPLGTCGNCGAGI